MKKNQKKIKKKDRNDKNDNDDKKKISAIFDLLGIEED